MLLTIDIGNTNIKLGVYEGATLLTHWRVTTERNRLADEYAVLVRNLFAMAQLDMGCIQGCAISCVVPPLVPQFRYLCRNYLGLEPLFVNSGIKTGLHYKIDSPNELGSDRVANSLAAYRAYAGPVIALAFGTATTLDVVTAGGEYIGGAIAPGIGISADALFRAAARLFQVELVRPPNIVGTNTADQIQSGLIMGYAGLVEGLVSRTQRELGGPCPVVATGGWADVIAQETSAISAVEPYLTLEGLRLIYAMNCE
ncbi:MAG: type III pantothenate kinase [Chloroflexaceae bacterium]|jgi:type III pantothenate kinase|nr:type III pantothenate kinase [Chloroflexaceae bacterium]